MTEQWFSHSGDIGDIIYALPTIRALGGGSLRLFHVPGKTAHGMSEGKANRLKTLLVKQPYIDQVVWSPGGPDHSLNGFRDHWATGNLADMHLATHGLDWFHRIEPWIAVEPVKVYDVIIHRSDRYHGSFPWSALVEYYQGKVGFVGFQDEHARFVQQFGEVPFVEAPDYLSLARVIAGAKWFAGNQSSPLAVAHAMKANVMTEICPGHSQQHCVYQRSNHIIVWDHKLELPKI